MTYRFALTSFVFASQTQFLQNNIKTLHYNINAQRNTYTHTYLFQQPHMQLILLPSSRNLFHKITRTLHFTIRLYVHFYLFLYLIHTHTHADNFLYAAYKNSQTYIYTSYLACVLAWVCVYKFETFVHNQIVLFIFIFHIIPTYVYK